MKTIGTIHSRHIENPQKEFIIRVLRSASFNVIYKPERYEMWKVLAETIDGAVKIARYHFYLSDNFELIS